MLYMWLARSYNPHHGFGELTQLTQVFFVFFEFIFSSISSFNIVLIET